jgi:hypothetical protein
MPTREWMGSQAQLQCCLLCLTLSFAPADLLSPAAALSPISCPWCRCVFQRPDDRNFIGVELSKDLGANPCWQ